MGISETPEGLQKQTGKALEYTRKSRVTANAKKCAVVVCDEDKVNLITFQGRGGGGRFTDRRPFYVPSRRDLKRLLLGCTQSEKYSMKR